MEGIKESLNVENGSKDANSFKEEMQRKEQMFWKVQVDKEIVQEVLPELKKTKKKKKQNNKKHQDVSVS